MASCERNHSHNLGGLENIFSVANIECTHDTMASVLALTRTLIEYNVSFFFFFLSQYASCYHCTASVPFLSIWEYYKFNVASLQHSRICFWLRILEWGLFIPPKSPWICTWSQLFDSIKVALDLHLVPTV
jgi:hypothetical protein